MTDYEMSELTKTLIGGDVNDSVLSAYITLAKNAILARLYPLDESMDIDPGLPSKYEVTACELACRYYARRGAEGETSHDENGISRTYGDTNDNDLLSRIVPYIKVVT